MMFYDVCNVNQRDCWIEVLDDFDIDGHLHIAINEMIPNHPNQAFKEQSVYLTKDQVIALMSHLSYSLNQHVNNPRK